MGGGKNKKVDPINSCVVEQSIPGWRTEIEPLRQDNLFWHGVWQSLGRPNTGHLFQLMKHVKNKYHYAIRRCKRAADSIRANKVFEAAKSGDVDLLKEMKRIKRSKEAALHTY